MKFLELTPKREVFKWASGFLHIPVRESSKELGACMFRPNLYHDVPRIREVLKDEIE